MDAPSIAHTDGRRSRYDQMTPRSTRGTDILTSGSARTRAASAAPDVFHKPSADTGASVPPVTSGLEPGGVPSLPQQMLTGSGPTNDPTKAVSFNRVVHVREILVQLSYADRCNATGLDPDAPREVNTAAGPRGGYCPIRHSRTESVPTPELVAFSKSMKDAIESIRVIAGDTDPDHWTCGWENAYKEICGAQFARARRKLWRYGPT